VVAGAALMFYILMLCYVHADAQRLGLRAWVWTNLVLLMSLFGFVLYLSYSAARTQDWKRVAMPVAYILEVAFPRAALSGMILAPPPPPAAPPMRGKVPIRPFRRIAETTF
jgi:hypothetical protein